MALGGIRGGGGGGGGGGEYTTLLSTEGLHFSAFHYKGVCD